MDVELNMSQSFLISLHTIEPDLFRFDLINKRKSLKPLESSQNNSDIVLELFRIVIMNFELLYWTCLTMLNNDLSKMACIELLTQHDSVFQVTREG
jgi:hypothetical protein